MGLLRLFLALSVVLWHIPEAHKALNASVAVTSFYIVSGFYMTLAINEKYASAREAWVGRFYAARFARLYPAYVFVVLVTVVVAYTGGVATGTFAAPRDMAWWEQASIIFANIVFLGQDLHQTVINAVATGSGPDVLSAIHRVFSPSFWNGHLMMVGQAWSIAVEVTFYLIAPFVVTSWRRTLAFLIVGLAVRWLLLGYLGYISWIWGYYFFPGCACMFALGACAYHLWRRLPEGLWQVRAGQGAMVALALWFGVGIALNGVAMPYGVGTSIDRPIFWVYYFAFAAAIPFIFQATRHNKVDRLVGETSYPVYIVQSLPIIAINNNLASLNATNRVSAMIALTLASGLLIHLLVERPFEAWRALLARRPVPAIT